MKDSPRQRDPKRTRQQLVKAAARLIQSRGLARVTTRQIAQEAGCAEGTLYKHFEDKDELFLAVILESLPSFEALLDPIEPGKATVLEGLRKVVLTAIAFFEKVLPHGVALLADASLLARHRKRLKKGADSGPRVLYQAVADYVSAEQQRGRLHPRINATSAAALILGPCFQWVMTRMINGAPPLPLTDEQFAGDVAKALLQGFSPRP